MKIRFNCGLFIPLVLLLGVYPVFAQSSLTGYMTKDYKIEGSKYVLQKGEKVECLKTTEKDCCFEEEEGSFCFPKALLLTSPVKMSDFYLSDIRISNSTDAKGDACKNGVDFKNRFDLYIWSYGFKVRSDDQARDPVLVELSISIKSNDVDVGWPRIVKRWTGFPDGKCVAIAITKRDIDNFLREYHKVSQYLSSEHDLNLDASVSLKLFSKRKEDNYENNVVEFGVRIPADNSATWPPTNLVN